MVCSGIILLWVTTPPVSETSLPGTSSTKATNQSKGRKRHFSTDSILSRHSFPHTVGLQYQSRPVPRKGGRGRGRAKDHAKNQTPALESLHPRKILPRRFVNIRQVTDPALKRALPQQ